MCVAKEQNQYNKGREEDLKAFTCRGGEEFVHHQTQDVKGRNRCWASYFEKVVKYGYFLKKVTELRDSKSN